MRQFKTIKTTTIVNENNSVETKTITELHTIRDWHELSEEEKEKEIESNMEALYEYYQDCIWQDFKYFEEDLKEDFKNIEFDNIYFDSSSQGGWIDSITNFKYHGEPIEIYGETLEVDDIDLSIRGVIKDFNINVYDYYIDSDKLARIVETKKYLKWIDNIHNDIQAWIDRVNEEAGFLISEEYNTPTDLNNPRERDYIDTFFDWQEFEDIKIIDNEESRKEENKNE